MTRKIRPRFRRLTLAAAAMLAALGLTIGTAAVASAGTPSPSPSPSASPLSLLRLRPEAFIVHANTADPAGTVFATGPVRGVGTGNFNPGPNVWTLTGPTGTVRVLHERLGRPVVDPATCTASLDQTGRWVLIGRSGADVRAFGFGTFRASVRVILARGLFGRCLPFARPLWRDVQVIGVGRAALLRLGVFAPRITPSLLPVS